MRTVVDNDGYHIFLKDRPALNIEEEKTTGCPVPILRTPEIAHPLVVDGEQDRIVVLEGTHRLADQLQRQGVCVVQHRDSGELFAVIGFSDGSVRRWS